MADGTRQAQQAPEAPERAKARGASARTEAAPDAARSSLGQSSVVQPSVARAATRPMLARRVGRLAGNAAAVRAIRRDPEDSGYEADDERDTPPSPSTQERARAPEPERAPVPEPSPLEGPVEDGYEADDEREELPRSRRDSAPELDPELEGSESEPMDEMAIYRRYVMLDTVQEVVRARRDAMRAQDEYAQVSGNLLRVANPRDVDDATGDLATKLAEATDQFSIFRDTIQDTKAAFEDVVARGDGIYWPALERREGMATVAQADEWIRDVGEALGTYQGVREALPAAMNVLGEAALGFARIGKDLEQVDYVQAVLPVGDAAHAAASRDVPERQDLSAIVARGTGSDSSSAWWGHGDVANTVAGVVLSALSLGSVAVAAAIGTVSGALSICFAAVGTILAVRASLSAHFGGKKVEAAKQYLTTARAQDVASYAKQQKSKKRFRQGALAVLGGATLGLAIAGLLTNPVGLIIAGIVASAIGLGVLVYKIGRSLWKRSRETKAAESLADVLETDARDGNDRARHIVREVNEGDRAKLVQWCATEVENQRHSTAREIVRMLASAVPSERFNGETLVEALGVAPAKVIKALDEGDAGKAVGLVERKLQSW